jgi:hypothetical protein
MKLTNVRAVFLLLMITALLITTATGSQASTLTKSSRGIKAVLKVTPEKDTIDLFLYNYSKRLTPVERAKVVAVVTLPDKTRVEKELMGMTMDGSFSYMNSLDLSLKGRYIFDIRVDAGAGPVRFKFTYDKK